jgi:LuxR family maltose regulon positive regulatory protein
MLSSLADIRITQGRLTEALATYERALRLADHHAETVLPGTADMYVGLSRVAFDRDDMDAATAHLLHSQELAERAALPQHPYRWRVAMAHVKEGQGDVPGALALLEEAQAVYTGDFLPERTPGSRGPGTRARHAWVPRRSTQLGPRAGLDR